MSKRPAFDPGILEQNKPSQSLKPLDFMRPMEETLAPEPATTDTAPADTTLTDASARTPERESVRIVAPTPEVERPLYLTPVDTSEKPFNRGFHMYPSRHKQLGDLAHYEERNPWEVAIQRG